MKTMDAKILALYLGCEVINQYGSRYKLTGVYTKAIPSDNVKRIQVFDGHHIFWFDIDGIKLLLRPLSSMTEEEGRGVKAGANDYMGKFVLFPDWQSKKFSVEQFQYLLSKGFDLFGLIESGQAIDSANP